MVEKRTFWVGEAWQQFGQEKVEGKKANETGQSAIMEVLLREVQVQEHTWQEMVISMTWI